MELSALAGNRRLKEQLAGQEERHGLSHAYILSGPPGSGRHTLARLLAAAMVCTAPPAERPCGRCAACRKVNEEIHPDVITLAGAGENKPISVDQVRALRADAYIRPNEGERKVYLLERAEEMNASAQNAMLKLLEEGPPYAAFLLLAENSSALLQTVRSRCEELALAPVSPQEGEQWLSRRFPNRAAEERRQAALDCQGILGRAVEQLEGRQTEANGRQLAERLVQVLADGNELGLMEQAAALEKMGREELLQVLDSLEVCLTERMTAGGGRRRLLRAAELVRSLRGAAKLNVSSGQLAGWLCAGTFLENQA